LLPVKQPWQTPYHSPDFAVAFRDQGRSLNIHSVNPSYNAAALASA